MGMFLRAKAPLRISFAGGGTDVPPFSQREGGCVLNATINRYAYATLCPRLDRQVRIDSLDFGLSVSYDLEGIPPYDGKLDLVKAAVSKLMGGDTPGIDLYLHSDAPPGSGLGASSALVVALVGLLKDFRNLPLTDYEIAEVAYVIERKDLGVQGGMQDQYAAAFGGFNYIEFLPDRVVVNPLKMTPDVVNELQYNLLLCYTGRTRLSAHILDDQIARYERGETESLEALRELKRLTVDMKNALLRRRLDEFGELLHYEWGQKRRMSPRISDPALDELYECARREGATGGKITGAGGGGYMLLYCPFVVKHRVAERMKELGCVIADFAFEPSGLQGWRVDQR
jgi:D-glycero-alpha-D-manno-heptose-7-phosphate kinase